MIPTLIDSTVAYADTVMVIPPDHVHIWVVTVISTGALLLGYLIGRADVYKKRRSTLKEQNG